MTQLYSKNNYNSLVSYTNDAPVHNLIAAHMSQFYNVRLVDGCIYPEQPSDDNNPQKNGNGLFGIDYDTLDHFVFVLDDQCLLYFPGDVEVIGFLPSSCPLLSVLNVVETARSNQ